VAPVAESPYCAHCGAELTDSAVAARRFGEPFCSEAHADAFASEVRAAKLQPVAPAAERAGACPVQAGAELSRRGTARWSVGRLAKWAVCCGAPLLALAFLAGGGGVLLGAGAAALPYLALLACPLAMFFMMRAMQHGEHSKDSTSDPTPDRDHRMDR
jgi:hypothetical protein